MNPSTRQLNNMTWTTARTRARKYDTPLTLAVDGPCRLIPLFPYRKIEGLGIQL